MNISIRKITPGDLSEIISMLREFAEFEKLTEFCTVTEERLFDAMFGTDSHVDGLIVFDGVAPAAYAIFFPGFSSFKGERGMYLEDVYVRTGYRGKGIGEKLLKEVARIAAARHCERIDFQVLAWNQPAIGFYEKLGAVRNDDVRYFKFADDAFRSLAS